MSYAAWSVVFGEQPSAAKWNILGTNDASFNDGTGIAGLYKNLLTVDSNPYKFSAYLTTAQTVGTSGVTTVLFDTEDFDTNSNFDVTTNKGRYTAPVSGFYQLNTSIVVDAGANYHYTLSLKKNGTIIKRGSEINPETHINHSLWGNFFIQLTAGDYVEIDLAVSATTNLLNGAVYCWFSGFFVSKT